MTDAQKISGVKSFLRRTKTTAELESLAASTFASATEEVIITFVGSEGLQTSGSVHFPRWLLLQAVEELLSEGTAPRQLCTVLDRSLYPSPL